MATVKKAAKIATGITKKAVKYNDLEVRPCVVYMTGRKHFVAAQYIKTSLPVLSDSEEILSWSTVKNNSSS